jgi:DNA-binding CsgD family transcriptional regulator
MLCHCLTFTIALDVARQTGINSLSIYGLVLCILHSSGLLPISSSLFFEPMNTTGILILLVGYLFVILAALMPSIMSKVVKTEPASTSEGLSDDQILAVAKERGLTARECEVFVMLARGRSAPYISEKLVLSEGTVKTHISRIYSKLDIHSRQELINLAETAGAPNASSEE